jgi:hypothetical protein
MVEMKLRSARDRKRSANGKCEGRKSYAEKQPAVVALAQKLHRKDRTTGKRLSFCKIATRLAEQGNLTASGKQYGASSIRSMLTS